MFKCFDACKQTYPYKELMTHKGRNVCYGGYSRPEGEEYQLKAIGKPLSQSVMPAKPVSSNFAKLAKPVQNIS